jgi:hypothetical protein
MNSSRAPARPARMPTSESWRPPPSREEPTTGTNGGLHGFKTLPPSPPHHHETGELNLNHAIGARRSILFRCCASTTSKCGAAAWMGPISSATVPRGHPQRHQPRQVCP